MSDERKPHTHEDAEPVIEMRDVTRSFGGRTILRNINLTVYRGETLVIMGPSGHGKSTLMRHMVGTYMPDSGSVRLLGTELTDCTRDELDAVRRRFGILFQSGALFNSMTVRENVALILEEHTDNPPDIIDSIVTIKLAQVDMIEHADKLPSQLSGGQKKRAGLARAMALDPEILFYDEPTSGLDPVGTAGTDQLVLDLHDKLGVTSVVVSHDMTSVFRIADRIVMIWNGDLAAVGTPDEIRNEGAEVVQQFINGHSEGPISFGAGPEVLERELLGR